MERGNLMCETLNCGQVAGYFGINGNLKVRCCEEHWPPLVEKGMQIISIEGYYFISNPQDIAAFNERKNTVERGRGNLRVFLNSCDWELMAALQNIEAAKGRVMKTVESRFEEIKVVMAGVCNEAKRQLWQLEMDFEQFLQSKENQLSPTASLLCMNVETIPKFMRFGIVDSSDRISAALSNSWTVASADVDATLRSCDANQKSEAIERALAEAVDRAQIGISDAVVYADSLFGGSAIFEMGKWKVVSEALKACRMKITENEKWLQRFWNLRQQYAFSDEATVQVGKQFASLLYNQYGRFSDAEAILRYCFDIASRQNLEPELSMSVCNEICGVYIASEQYEYVERIGVWALEHFAADNLPAEHYWTTLLYIVYSMGQLSKYDEAIAIIENRRNLYIQRESKLFEMLHLATFGIGTLPFNSDEAYELFLQARYIGTSHFPTSSFTALVFSKLGQIRITDARSEQYLTLAQSIYEVISPKSAQAAINLSKLGDVNRIIGQLSKIEQCYCQAQEIYEKIIIKSNSAAINFIKLGEFYSLEKRWSDIEKCCTQAHSILNGLNPIPIEAAASWLELGFLWKIIERWDKIEECDRQIMSIVERASTHQRVRLENVIGKLEDLRARFAEFPFDAPRQGNTQAAIKLLGISKEGVLRLFDIQSTAWEPPLVHREMHIDEWTTYTFVSSTAAVLCSSIQ